MATVDVCPVEELPPGHVKIVWSGPIAIGVYNCGGRLYAIEDRCSHDDGPLCEGEWEEDECIAICPRHGSRFDITTGARAHPAGLRAGRDLPGPGRGRLGPRRGLDRRRGRLLHSGYPRKGGGPAVEISSTGSGGASR